MIRRKPLIFNDIQQKLLLFLKLSKRSRELLRACFAAQFNQAKPSPQPCASYRAIAS